MNASEFQQLNESIFDILEAIRKRPLFYLTERSFIQLNIFIIGYKAGLGRVRFTLKDDLHEFNNWVAQKLGCSNSTSGHRMILENCKNDSEAFDKFYALLDEVRNK